MTAYSGNSSDFACNVHETYSSLREAVVEFDQTRKKEERQREDRKTTAKKEGTIKLKIKLNNILRPGCCGCMYMYCIKVINQHFFCENVTSSL